MSVKIIPLPADQTNHDIHIYRSNEKPSEFTLVLREPSTTERNCASIPGAKCTVDPAKSIFEHNMEHLMALGLARINAILEKEKKEKETAAE